MGKGSLLSGQAKNYKGNQKHKPGCPKGKLASKLVSNTALTKEICFFSRIHTANVINTRKCDRQGNNSRKLQLVDHYDKCMGVLT